MKGYAYMRDDHMSSHSSSGHALRWIGLIVGLLGLMLIANLMLVLASMRDGGAQALHGADDEAAVLRGEAIDGAIVPAPNHAGRRP